jgi:hypothetical protein
MEKNATPHEDEDEYVLLDLDGVYGLIDILPNSNYVLTVSSQSVTHQFLHIFHSMHV